MSRPPGDSLHLTPSEIAKVSTGTTQVLTRLEAAALLKITPKTLDEWKRKGRLPGTFRKRGRHVYFWRDRLIKAVFNEPSWPKTLTGTDAAPARHASIAQLLLNGD